jgi:DNA-binding HxlR family transcriptional regulator
MIELVQLTPPTVHDAREIRSSASTETVLLDLSTGSRLRTVADNVAQVLTVAGDRWALLVVREVALGLRRFGQIQAATGAPRTILSDRLRHLTAAGILATRPYQVPGSRSRLEYTLTDAGFDLLPVLSALSDWGERHLPPGAVPDIVYRHAGCGGRVTVKLQCECGEQTEPRGRLMAEVNR